MDVTQNVQISNLGSRLLPPSPGLDELAREYAANKAKADALTARNAEIAESLAAAAAFKDGSNTGHLSAGGFNITITRKFNTKWLAEKLEDARAKLTDELFFKVFAWRYEPRSKKELDGFLKFAAPDFRAVILAAMETSPGKPSVKLEVMQ